MACSGSGDDVEDRTAAPARVSDSAPSCCPSSCGFLRVDQDPRVTAAQTFEARMHHPFVDSASFMSEGSENSDRREPFRSSWLLTLALVMAVAASSAALLAL
jgi:hypothetical protein